MPVEDVFTITGRGTVATGRVERGQIKTGEEVEIVGLTDEKRKVVEEWSMTATFVLSKNVNLATELCVWVNCTWLSKYLTSLDFISLNTTEKNTYVVACFSEVKSLSEHFKTFNNNFSLFVCKTGEEVDRKSVV